MKEENFAGVGLTTERSPVSPALLSVHRKGITSREHIQMRCGNPWKRPRTRNRAWKKLEVQKE
ncbi:hypothetical protein RvY_14173 [Ramazzottius varieornatus]|uniref:Uncharacterized protein n=1 Tax=Ramazzottius varieornatus TaxID=947166 RepID=A0A1D1VXP6_RAMVA|nr:hypothetical protein RvY_14173 [Ramazzottius varieornatus]